MLKESSKGCRKKIKSTSRYPIETEHLKGKLRFLCEPWLDILENIPLEDSYLMTREINETVDMSVLAEDQKGSGVYYFVRQDLR